MIGGILAFAAMVALVIVAAKYGRPSAGGHGGGVDGTDIADQVEQANMAAWRKQQRINELGDNPLGNIGRYGVGDE